MLTKPLSCKTEGGQRIKIKYVILTQQISSEQQDELHLLFIAFQGTKSSVPRDNDFSNQQQLIIAKTRKQSNYSTLVKSLKKRNSKSDLLSYYDTCQSFDKRKWEKYVLMDLQIWSL